MTTLPPGGERFPAPDGRFGGAPAGIVRGLRTLVDDGRRFATVYADPPWPYRNVASRAAAENHYRTMTLDEIRREPVAEVCEPDAHLHLWTTNAFLREAFTVIRAWGFRYKSCLVWVKPQLGMGNYWRVSHEFLLFGVRGRLPFRDNTCPSWVLYPRRVHSRKPWVVRQLIERVSPGPYLEMYGREEIPRSPWTVYGNQVERRLF
jgi:N6-adenosine-specific RNA methylase IME4